MSRRLAVPVGSKFGRWTVVGSAAPAYRGSSRWAVECECGVESDVCPRSLIRGDSKSCGCLNREVAAARARASAKHGYSGSPTHDAWCSMKQRCYYPSHAHFRLYGGRGIAVCERWRLSFVAFVSDMGERPSPLHSLDRIDPDGNYTPENCRWATRVEQARNTRQNVTLTAFGRTQCIAAWCEEFSINQCTLRHRINKGLSIEDALTRRVRCRRSKGIKASGSTS